MRALVNMEELEEDNEDKKIIQWLDDHPRPELTEAEKRMQRKLYAPLLLILGIYCYLLLFASSLISEYGLFVFVFLYLYDLLLVSFIYFHVRKIRNVILEDEPDSFTLEIMMRRNCIVMAIGIIYFQLFIIMRYSGYCIDNRDYEMMGIIDDMYFLHLLFSSMIFLIIMYKYEQYKKQLLYGSAARRLGLNFSMNDRYHTIEKYHFIDTIRNVVRNMTIACVISGLYRKRKIRVFIIHPKGHWGLPLCIYMSILKLSTEFPELKAWPTGSFRVGMRSDLPEVDFDNLDFSRKYNVKCGSRQFANDVFHPRMMELFQKHETVYFEIEDDIMFMYFRDQADPNLLKEQLDKVVRIREMLPSYLFPTTEDDLAGETHE